MRRFNSQSVSRHDLVRALETDRFVRRAIEVDHCLLCHATGVGRAGLCEGCMANLTESEWEAAKPWLEERKH
ncbi:MAG: hypothetical protein U0R49_07800 [Fimbriimonadales bacterium]